LDGAIVGEVALWGHIVQHRLGYRAEYARRLKLSVQLEVAGPQIPPAIIPALARRTALLELGIPVEIHDRGSGLRLDFEELRRLLTPAAPIPLHREVWRSAWHM
jgi:hypothetical protein